MTSRVDYDERLDKRRDGHDMTSPDSTTSRRTPVRRPGDRVIRRGVLQRETYRVRQPVFRRRQRHPAVALILGFIALILIGSALLSTPLASASGSWTSPLIALFTATSAVCVTGLVVVDTATHWSTFGEVVILALIQIGGFGFLTSSTLLLILAGRRTTRARRRRLPLPGRPRRARLPQSRRSSATSHSPMLSPPARRPGRSPSSRRPPTGVRRASAWTRPPSSMKR